MHGVEAAIFASSEPVGRETLARIVGKSCSIDLVIDDIRAELRGRPDDLVAVGGGWRHLTRPAYADAIQTTVGAASPKRHVRRNRYGMAAGTANDSLLQDASRLARPTTMAEVVATTTGAAKNEEAASKSVSVAQASSAGVTAIDGKVNTCEHGCGTAEQERSARQPT